jgi:hypothetical protein
MIESMSKKPQNHSTDRNTFSSEEFIFNSKSQSTVRCHCWYPQKCRQLGIFILKLIIRSFGLNQTLMLIPRRKQLIVSKSHLSIGWKNFETETSRIRNR